MTFFFGDFMEKYILIAFCVVAFLLLFVLIKLFASKKTSSDALLLDLKNQLMELKTKQLENQNNAMTQQQQFFLKSNGEVSKQLNQIMKIVNENLTTTQGNINSQLKNSNLVINDIRQKLGALESTTNNIQEIGKDISSLQDILQAPKLRGNLGEYMLSELLKDILPKENYALQYSFKNGTKVDAIIKLSQGLVPVDSKFPLESFQRFVVAKNEDEKKAYKKEFITSVKKRIDEISTKYINPSENTFDFALMYIPAENVFYEIVINESLFEYAMKSHVVIVSPNSFYSYLMAIGYGLKGLRIEQEAKRITAELSVIQDSFNKFFQEFLLLGKHISNANGKYDELTKKAEKLNTQMENVIQIKN